MATATCLRHQAFLYDSPDDFAASMAPFVREGLDRGDPIFGATKPANIAALREELGDDGAGVELHDTSQWQAKPYGRLQAFKAMAEAVPEGRVLRAMGEPVWEGSPAMVRQWARYESLINLALAPARMQFVCLYDGAALPDRILDYAVRTHPERIERDGTSPCPSFVSPSKFRPGEAEPAPSDAHPLPIDGASPFRRALVEYMRANGLAGPGAEDFVLAANEVATNALVHGRPPRSARVWARDGELVCQVDDAGPGLHDPLAGWLPPTDIGRGGWGLPIARQLCDVVDIAVDRSGTRVSLHLSRDG